MKHTPALSSMVVLFSSFTLFSSLGCSSADPALSSGAAGASGSSGGSGGVDSHAGGAAGVGEGGGGGAAGNGGSGGSSGSGPAGAAGQGGSSSCEVASDCMGEWDAPCASADCNEGLCRVSFAPMGTVIADDQPGDCHVPSCDGEGHIKKAVNGLDIPEQIAGDCQILSCNGFGQVVSKTDDTDTPDDGNECTEDHCVLGATQHGFTPANTPCGQISGVCTGTGYCGVCIPDAFSCAGGQAQRCTDIGGWQPSDECGALGCSGDSCVQPVQVVVGTKHSCARMSNETVRCWGDNDRGQIGIDSYLPNKTTPFKIGSLSGVSDIGSGEQHVCALTHDGSVYCWGDNSKGQVGVGSSAPVVFLPHLVAQNATRLFVGWNTTCVMRSTGDSLCWGDNTSGLANVDLPASVLTSPTAGLSHANPGDSFSFGSAAGCTTHQGSLSCWGSNSTGVLSPTPLGGAPNPTWTNAAQGASSVSVGAQFGCAVVSGLIKCWGTIPMLVNGSVSVSQQFPTLVSDIADAVTVESGAASACAALPSGEARCWGDNPSHAFGAEDAAFAVAQPLTLSLPSPVTSMAPPKGAHACFVANGKAYCAGNNTHGQLGIGSVLPRTTLTEVVW